MKRSIVWVLGALALGPSVGLAGSTRSFVIDTNEAFEKGTLKGAASHKTGKLTRAASTARTPIDGVPVAYASAVGKDGAIYVGTGNEGAIYRVTAEGAKLFADTPAALVTSLVFVDDTLYAGTLPGGKVYAIAGDGKVAEHAKLEGADHVWALAYAPKKKTLYAATGPEGKLFAIGASRKAELVHDDQAEHLLSLDLDAEERVYAGTSNGARLVRISGREVQVLYDFPGQELTVIDVGPQFVAVASNEFPAPPPAAGETKDLGAAARTKRLKPGKGTVFVLGHDGHIEELGQFEDGHVSALAIDGNDAVQAGLAQEGRIVRLSRSGDRALWADVDERQIVAIKLGGSAPHIVSSDGVAVYRVKPPETEGEWLSAALDAKAPARFGELIFRASGSVKMATRSGNTETPDASWSAWSADSTASSAPIKSPPARFVQLRAKLLGEAELYAVEAYYLPQNLPARVRNVRVKPSKGDAAKGPSSVMTLTWDVDNPDDDKLRYRIEVQREGQSSFLPQLREHEVLEQTEYAWETRGLPDGYYRVRVSASDEAENPEPYATVSRAQSAPLLVDTHPPQLLDMRFELGNPGGPGKLTGRALDGVGPIARLEIAIDSGLYRPFFPTDDLLDRREERFALSIARLAPGLHTISVRATDAAQNATIAALEVSVPAH